MPNIPYSTHTIGNIGVIMSRSALEEQLANIAIKANSTKKPSPTLSQIYVYPIKSITGIEQSSSWVEPQGLSFDRRFMVASLNGRMVTARENPQMVRVKAALQANGLVLTYPEAKPLHLNYADCVMDEVTCQVWKDEFQAYSTSQQANDWFSFIIGKKVQLLFTGEQSNRQRKKIQTNVSFADGYPLLLVSQASLDELNQRSSSIHSMAQFRPNLVVCDTEAFAEDSWKRIRIGEVEFEVIEPCMRCVLTTVNPKTAMRNEQNEPLKTMATFRANESGGVFFGQNLIAKNEGMILKNDKVIVLERKVKDFYPDTSADIVEVESVKKVSISVNGKIFEGDNQSTLLEQAEQAGVSIRSSCRSGYCGACLVTLESGDVEQREKLISSNEREILACSCIPKSDIEVVY